MMGSLKILICLVLIGLATTRVCCGASVGVQDNIPDKSGDVVVEKTTNDVNREGKFLDELLAVLDGMDMKVENFVNQGSSVVQRVQQFQGGSGATKIIKTEITQTFGGNAPFGVRYKRDLGDKLEGLFDTFVNKVDTAKDKMAGVISDTYNTASLGYIKAKDAIANKLKPTVVVF